MKQTAQFCHVLARILGHVPGRAPGHALAAVFAGLLVIGMAPAMAMDDSDNDKDNSAKASALTKARASLAEENWEAAIADLEVAVGDDPDNPDILNLLGYSHRNLGNYDDALVFYQRALSLAPEHKGVNEYLGQLYLSTGDLPKAEERLGVLDKACFLPCKEFTALEEAIAAYKSKNGVN